MSTKSSKKMEPLNKEDEAFVDVLVDKYKEDSLALFVGAGFAMNAALPSWKNLLRETTVKKWTLSLADASSAVISMGDVPDLAEYAQYYANSHKVHELKESISEVLQKYEKKYHHVITGDKKAMAREGKQVLSDSKSSKGGYKLFKLFRELNFKNIWTTNYDKIIETYVASELDVFMTDDSLRRMNDVNKTRLFKLHGDVEDSASIAITQAEIEERRHRLMMDFFKRDLIAYHFLFIGYSFKDQVVLHHLEKIKDMLKSTNHEHYALMCYDPKKVDEKEKEKNKFFYDDLKTRYNINVLQVEKNKLYHVLKELKERVCQRNVFISGSLPADDFEEHQEAMKLCKELTKQLIDKNYKIYTGFGNEIGCYVAAGALFMGGENRDFYGASKNLEIRPYTAKQNEQALEEHRIKILSECRFAIFIYGRTEKSGGGMCGVRKEFNLARKMGLTLIPIAATGYEAEKLWKKMNKPVKKPYGNNADTVVESLMHINDQPTIPEIAQAVVNIINKVTDQKTDNQAG